MPTLDSGEFLFGSALATPPAPHAFRVERIFGAGLLRGDSEVREHAVEDGSDVLHGRSVSDQLAIRRVTPGAGIQTPERAPNR